MGKKYDQLDIDERYEIYRLHEAGRSRGEIGRLMGRSASTIGRELRRNSLPKGGYKPASADRIALSRRRRSSRIERLSPLRSYVGDRLAMGWSPEQIAGRLRLEGSEHTVCHETIYRFIYRPRLRIEKLYRFLPRARRRVGGVTSNDVGIRSRGAGPFTIAHRLSKAVTSSVIGRATSCSFAPSGATC
jgi:IS30 family transposase